MAYMTRPTTEADIRVPAKAKALMAPMLRKKGFTCSENPASNIMGGSSAIKKNSVCMTYISSCMSELYPQQDLASNIYSTLHVKPL